MLQRRALVRLFASWQLLSARSRRPDLAKLKGLERLYQKQPQNTEYLRRYARVKLRSFQELNRNQEYEKVIKLLEKNPYLNFQPKLMEQLEYARTHSVVLGTEEKPDAQIEESKDFAYKGAKEKSSGSSFSLFTVVILGYIFYDVLWQRWGYKVKNIGVWLNNQLSKKAPPKKSPPSSSSQDKAKPAEEAKADLNKKFNKIIAEVGEMQAPGEIKQRLSDVKGIDEITEEIYDVINMLKKNKEYTKKGATLPKGILLYGKPGTGKTLIARAMAGEANVNFFHYTGSMFDEMYVGVGARRVRNMFSAARKNKPCIIFIDEIDTLLA